ncbi:hypothetical protein Tco_0326720 [Tanacetum coccineum]
MDIELSKEFLMELHSNAYCRMYDEDVVDHIAKVLKILNLIKTPNIDEGDGKITTWEELVEKFFCKFFPISRDGEDEMVSDNDNSGRDPIEFISQNKEPMDDIVSSDEEWEESYYENPPNSDTNSFFKPYLDAQEKNDIGKGDERSPKKCKATLAKKFKVIKYSLGPNEEYIAINNCEGNAWKRNKDSMSHIYQEIFCKRDEGWTVTRTKE